MTLEDQKKAARADAMVRRTKAHAAADATAPLALAERGMPIAPAAGRNYVSGFFPYQTEIDVRPLLTRLAGEGWTPCLPIVLGANLPLDFRRWYPGEPTIPGKWNIPVPLPDQPMAEPDVLLVPMLAFDRLGYRLGYGGGFYDRTLQKLRAQKPVTAIGVAYAAQEMETVPYGEFDQPLDYILTEQELFQPDFTG